TIAAKYGINLPGPGLLSEIHTEPTQSSGISWRTLLPEPLLVRRRLLDGALDDSPELGKECFAAD
nr:hypothetical protein [Desulfobacterales bacterium]